MRIFQDLEFVKTIDVGNVLTLATLVVGFFGWLLATRKQRSAAANEEAKSGALRLLLRLLRTTNNAPARLDELREKYNSPELKADRIAYCGRNFLFKTKAQFEGAVYQLDWEGKTRFVGADEIVFRIDMTSNPLLRFVPNESDKAQMLAVLKRGLEHASTDTWELERIAESCMKVAPAETTQILREKLKSGDEVLERRVVQVLRALVPAGPAP